jgi:hypothetical protein
VLKHQFCIRTDSGHRCSELDSLPRSVTSKDWEDASAVQLLAVQLLVNSSLFYGLVQTTGVRAQSMVGTGLITVQMPADQWIVEARAMESSVWAALQISLADYAIGPIVRHPEIADYIWKATTPGEKRLCGSQKMRKAGGFV